MATVNEPAVPSGYASNPNFGVRDLALMVKMCGLGAPVRPADQEMALNFARITLSSYEQSCVAAMKVAKDAGKTLVLPEPSRAVGLSAKLISTMAGQNIALAGILVRDSQGPSQEVHIHQGTEVHVAAAVVCPPEVSEKLRSLPDDTLRAIADMTLEEGTDDDCPEQPGAD